MTDTTVSAGTGATGIEFGIYLPQVGIGFEEMLARSLEVERLGYDALWLYDHLYAPGQPQHPSLEAWTLATALLARTERLRVGHLVLCNNFRHPAVLAKMATTLDVISGGRVELGIGSGSVQDEHDQAGIGWGSLRERSERLGEALEIITRMLAAPVTTWQGQHYAVRDLPNLPRPAQQPRPPIHIGGAGPKRTLPLVARYADVWNMPTYALDRIGELSQALDGECERIGRDPASIRRSVEAVMVVAPPQRLDEAMARARRHYGWPGFGLEAGGFTGTPARVGDRIAELAESGFSSFTFFTHDRASTQTLELFAGEVMPRFARLRPAGSLSRLSLGERGPGSGVPASRARSVSRLLPRGPHRRGRPCQIPALEGFERVQDELRLGECVSLAIARVPCHEVTLQLIIATGELVIAAQGVPERKLLRPPRVAGLDHVQVREAAPPGGIGLDVEPAPGALVQLGRHEVPAVGREPAGCLRHHDSGIGHRCHEVYNRLGGEPRDRR